MIHYCPERPTQVRASATLSAALVGAALLLAAAFVQLVVRPGPLLAKLLAKLRPNPNPNPAAA
jgi:hypothetical protein